MSLLRIEKNDGSILSIESLEYNYPNLIINNIYKVKKRDYVIFECDESGEVVRQQFRFKKKFFTSPIYKDSIQKKKTNLERYGVENPYQSPEIKKRIKKTNLKKYGKENAMQNEEISLKSQTTQREKNGGVLGWNNQNQKQSLKEIYGNEVLYRTQHFKEESRKTKKERYDDEQFNNPEKRRETNLERYGSEVLYGSDYFKEKSKLTMLEKYGVEYPSQVKEIYSKIESTMLRRYGSKTFLTSDAFIEMGIHNISRKYQSEIEEFLLSYDIDFQSNNRKIISPQELDIYIPSHNLAIEFNGLYWHSDIYKDRNYHLNKTLECEKQGIQLIHIFEDEWLAKKDIVKSRLKNILGLNSDRIGARKTKIREIDSRLKNDFLNQYHLQGADKSSIKLGAFHGDQLIGVMTFSKPRIFMNQKVRDGVWELSRFATMSDMYTPGLASKMLKHFKKNYDWKEIYSYADRRWSQGNLYRQIGFEFDSFTMPNYYYTNNPKKRYHRYNFRKQNLKTFPNYSSDKTEKQIMDEAGWLRVYDCGNLKFVLSNKDYI